jgi:hypothetical protein
MVVEALLADPPPAAQLQGFWRCAIATAPRRAPEFSYKMRIRRDLYLRVGSSLFFKSAVIYSWGVLFSVMRLT